jgi:hypothetical protein
MYLFARYGILILAIGIALMCGGLIYAGAINMQFYLPHDSCFGDTSCPYDQGASMTINVLIWLGLSMALASGGIELALYLTRATANAAIAAPAAVFTRTHRAPSRYHTPPGLPAPRHRVYNGQGQQIFAPEDYLLYEDARRKRRSY